MKNSMDYIYTSGEQKILIEAEQAQDNLSLSNMCAAGKLRASHRKNLQRGQEFPEAILQDSKVEIIIHLWK